MRTAEIKDKPIWEDFLFSCQEKTFVSSWNWGEFQKALGNKIWRLGIYEGNKLASVALVIKIAARRGTFLFLPHGPVLKNEAEKKEILQILLIELKKIAQEEKASFIRISPIWLRSEENAEVFISLGFIEAPLHMHPEVTWELDLKPSEEDLLHSMRKTTRYLVKQAEKNMAVKITLSENLEDVEKFSAVYGATVDRHHFIPFSLNYLKKELLAFQPDHQIMVFSGRYQEEVVASAMVIFWSGIAFYHQGASSQKYAKVPVSYLLQWEAIKEAKKRGCKLYNFWGIAPNDNPRHPWAGLSLFKMGFGGQRKEYVKTQDLPLSFKYHLIRLFETLRRAKRNL
jgi:lipid II:glycine glycyltransferase (peptidoglycan interpeptide bridge formation enzyme)